MDELRSQIIKADKSVDKKKQGALERQLWKESLRYLEFIEGIKKMKKEGRI